MIAASDFQPEECFTPPQLARLWHVHRAKITAWCEAGLFPGAFNCANSEQQRRWKIPISAIRAFQEARGPKPPVHVCRRKPQPKGKFY